MTGMLRAVPPSTETVPFQPESHATERITVDATGASTRTCSDLVVLEITCTESGAPALVRAEMGDGGLA